MHGVLHKYSMGNLSMYCERRLHIIAQSPSKMFTAKSIPVAHKDLIHDVAYDFHGKRMATCSSDQCVKVTKTDFREMLESADLVH